LKFSNFNLNKICLYVSKSQALCWSIPSKAFDKLLHLPDFLMLTLQSLLTSHYQRQKYSISQSIPPANYCFETKCHFDAFSQYDLAGIRFFETINDTHYSRFPEPFLAMKAIFWSLLIPNEMFKQRTFTKRFRDISTER
jgi:hypothetical protein